MITNVEYSVKNKFNFTFDCEKTCIIYCLGINEFSIASCPKSSYLHEDFQNFTSLRYINNERYFAIKNSRQIQYDYVICSGFTPPDFGGVRVAYPFGCLCFFFVFVLCLVCPALLLDYHSWLPLSVFFYVYMIYLLIRFSLTFIWCICFGHSMNCLSVTDLCVTKDCITAGKYYM